MLLNCAIPGASPYGLQESLNTCSQLYDLLVGLFECHLRLICIEYCKVRQRCLSQNKAQAIWNREIIRNPTLEKAHI